MRGKIKISIILISIIMMALIPNSYGALTSKPTTKTDGSNVLVNKNVSAEYLLCQQMTSNGESLYGTSVKPHLATNKDWGAVSYLSNSVYGTNTTGQNKGVERTINGVRYYSTTGNASGVMNWGCNPYKSFVTHTAGLSSNCATSYNSITELFNNRESEYVEYINFANASLTKGMCMQETSGKYGVTFGISSDPANYPVTMRNGLFGGYHGSRWSSPEFACYGDERGTVTFRPVVWN